MRIGGQLNIRLSKKIPMGGGLGGGSSDAAAILLALPALAGKTLPTETLLELAAGLGSDVPFFLFGGSAVAQGRGTELYGLPDIRNSTESWSLRAFMSRLRRPTKRSAVV